MYMKIADAQKAAYHSYIKTKSKKRLEVPPQLMPTSHKNPLVPREDQGKWYWALPTKSGEIKIEQQIGSGSWSTAYLASDDSGFPQIVFLETSLEDESKSFLSEMNRMGVRTHIPIIEEFSFDENEDSLPIYKMPLYNRFGNSEKAEDYNLFELLKKAQQKGDRVLYDSLAETYQDLALESREAVINYLKSRINERTSPANLEDIIEDLEYMHNFLIQKEAIYIFEFPSNNLGLDGEGKVILLDVLYPITIALGDG